jgi:hypothetical protein
MLARGSGGVGEGQTPPQRHPQIFKYGLYLIYREIL